MDNQDSLMAAMKSHHVKVLLRIGLVALVCLMLAMTVYFTKSVPAHAAGVTSTVVNFNSSGDQVTRYDTMGNAIDAHDGEIHQFGSSYYFYGTNYNCGYVWEQAGTPFCGFKVYSSTDLVHWVDDGTLFDATTSTWQGRCATNGSNVQGNCFRPHILYNSSTKLYVLWVKDYTAAYHFRVLTSTTPTGPFVEESSVPKLALTNAGDENLFEDSDGTAYIVYTDRNDDYDLAIERLNSSYTSGTGTYIRLGLSTVEAPAMYKRNSTYYVQYSDPNCGYCGGTGTSYKTASSPLGTWSAGNSITSTSCGGQPTNVASIATTSGTLYLYQSDLWNDGAHNEALANYFWGPLSFNSNGSIQKLSCVDSFQVSLSDGQAGSQQQISGLDQSDGVSNFRTFCDVAGKVERLQTFTPSASKVLASVALTTFQEGAPNAAVSIDIVRVNAQGQPTSTLSSHSISASDVGWSARNVIVYPNIAVTAGQSYGILLHSATTKGCYGAAYNDSDVYSAGKELYSSNSGSSFTVETNRALKFFTTLTNTTGTPNYALGATPSASSSVEGHDWSLAYVNDGQRTSTPSSMGWSSNNDLTSNHTEWVQLDLGTAEPLDEVDLYPRSDGVNAGYGFPISFTIAVSNDGKTWTTVVTKTNYPRPTTATVQAFTFTSHTDRYVRVQGTTLGTIPTESNRYRMQFAEIEVY